MSFHHRLVDRTRCDCCATYEAQGLIELPNGVFFRFCRSCLRALRASAKELHKLLDQKEMEQRSKEG